ncbi:MAG TPA: CopG family antitoxin [Thermomicrobiaceae bacterium]|nr:CopG family antitoxin [Thermomicrobiaceae bacterium]
MSKPKPSIDFGYPTEAHGRIPAFQNIEEEAEFWDTHDVTEFMGVELQPVEVTVGPELADRLTVRLDRADREALTKRARAMGIGPSTLARIWLKERLRQEDAAHSGER